MENLNSIINILLFAGVFLLMMKGVGENKRVVKFRKWCLRFKNKTNE